MFNTLGCLFNPDHYNYQYGGNFGFATAINSTHVLISDYSVGDPIIPGEPYSRGLAYLINHATGVVDHVFVPATPSSVDENISGFGYSVALTETHAIIGIWQASVGGLTNAGKTFVYRLSDYHLLYEITEPIPVAGSFFGMSCAANDLYFAVGAQTPNSDGAVYVFNFSDGSLRYQVPAVHDNWFGKQLEMNSTHLLVASNQNDTGYVFLFDVATGTQLHQFLNPDGGISVYFGIAIAMTENYVLVTASEAFNDEGCGYVFDLSDYSLKYTLRVPGNLFNDTRDYVMGMSCGLTDNIVALATDEPNGRIGATYVFNMGDGGFIQTLTVDVNDYGLGYGQRPTALSIVDNRIVVGADNMSGFYINGGYIMAVGGAVFYTTDGTVWGDNTIIENHQAFMDGFMLGLKNRGEM